jgi:hypothetical protein
VRQDRARAVTSTVGTVLLVATVLLVSVTVAAFATGYADELREPSLAAVETEQTTVDFGGDSECGGPEEVVVEVTLTQLQQADRIYVIVTDEGDERLRTLWDDPGSADVGETLVLANEVPGPEVDVDVGGGSDYALCPGDRATFEFYAETDGQTTILQRLEL